MLNFEKLQKLRCFANFFAKVKKDITVSIIVKTKKNISEFYYGMEKNRLKVKTVIIIALILLYKHQLNTR